MIHYKSCDGTQSIDLVHTCDACDSTELGRVRSLVLIKKGTSITVPLVKSEWTAAIESGNIIVIPRTRGSFDGGSPKTGTGYGDETERKLSDDYVLTVIDPAYVDNVSFWSAAEKETWNIAYRSETLLHYVKSDVRLTAKAPIEEDIDSEVVWNIELKWNSKEKPVSTPFSAIEDVFKCFEITDDTEEVEETTPGTGN